MRAKHGHDCCCCFIWVCFKCWNIYGTATAVNSKNWRARAQYDFLLIKSAFCKWIEMDRYRQIFGRFCCRTDQTHCRFVYISSSGCERANSFVCFICSAFKLNLWVDFCWCLAIISVRIHKNTLFVSVVRTYFSIHIGAEQTLACFFILSGLSGLCTLSLAPRVSVPLTLMNYG